MTGTGRGRAKRGAAFLFLKALALGGFRHLVPQPEAVTSMVLLSHLFAVRSGVSHLEFKQSDEKV